MIAEPAAPALTLVPFQSVAACLATLTTMEAAGQWEAVRFAQQFVNDLAQLLDLDAIRLWRVFMDAPAPVIRNLWHPDGWPVLAADLLGEDATRLRATVH